MDDYGTCVCVFLCRGSVKETCKMLMALGISSREVYEDDFEKPLLSESREFYRVSLIEIPCRKKEGVPLSICIGACV